MDEKQLLGGSGLPRWQQLKRGSTWLIWRGGKSGNIAFIFIMVATSAQLILLAADSFLSNRLTNEGVLNYEGEHVQWRPCGEVDSREMECGSIVVPLDHFNEHDHGHQTFSIALVRLRGRNATKNIIVNPGGPGGAGISFVKRRGKELRAIIGEDHHILGFDPRGVGQSTPLAVCFPDQRTREQHQWDKFLDVVRDGSRAFASSQNLAQACADTMSDYGKYINTPQTAADMNIILSAVGQNGMVYWGFSYGTILGQTYAAMFPDRSERVIIDGVANQFDWYNSLVDVSSLADAKIFGDNAKSLQHNVTQFIHNLRQDPIGVYVDSKTYGILDYKTMWYEAVFHATYKPVALWYQLADSFANLMSGNGSKALHHYVLDGPWSGSLEMEHNMVISNNDHRSGKLEWPQSKEKILELALPLLDNSIFGEGQATGLFERAFWQIPATHTYKPKLDVKTRHPLLILSTTYDPVCPLSSAKVAQEFFRDSKLVEVEGYGHSSIAVQSTCIAKHVRAYLNNGILSDEKHSKCTVDGKYFFSPEDNAFMTSGLAMSEEEEIWAAQRGLSEAMGFIPPFK